MDAGGFSSVSPSQGAYRQQQSRSSDNSSSSPARGSSNSDGLASTLVQQLTAISQLLASQQTVRVDQIMTLLNEKICTVGDSA